ncbi:MAG: two-component sensor histidine kinase [Gemmatimonadota bacterium]|nr:MAG: two-component sensor histidine kinase [Gemmatimonadota bacterium]
MSKQITRANIAKDEVPIAHRRYRKVLIVTVLLTSIVAVVPLVIMTGINFRQYRNAFNFEITRPMLRFVALGQQSMATFLSQRHAMLERIARENTLAELQSSDTLTGILADIQTTYTDVIDLGLIDDRGVQISYAGPHDLRSRDYAFFDWYRQLRVGGSSVSDVVTDYTGVPHFNMAVQHRGDDSHLFTLRAAVDANAIHWLGNFETFGYRDHGSRCQGCHSLGVQASSDAFLINGSGVLQTPSLHYGQALAPSLLPSLPARSEATLVELEDGTGQALIVSYADVAGSPFRVVLVSPRTALHAGSMSLRRDLLIFMGVSILLIVAVVIGGSTYVVNRAREADLKRAVYYHELEYANKMAALGRLSAGVAHEINNPIAIINQSAGLLRDLMTWSKERPSREKILSLTNSILNSARRCGRITHNLLGFAKHMEVEHEKINLDRLLREVLGFLGKEASYRQIEVAFDYSGEPPSVVSDKGQLQQVFLNIINNAFAAVEDGGRIEIGIDPLDEHSVAVSITDNGAGIAEENLAHIFDPFFTTKEGSGTGLGLSITYGIVKKLGGSIDVTSEVGKGTRFTITLPTGEPDA